MKFTNAKRGAAIAVKVMPRARKTEVAGVMEDGTIKIRVAAPPVDGAANKALVVFLATALNVSSSQIDIVAGETSERKLISVVGISPQEVDAAFQRLVSGASNGLSAKGKPAGR